MVVINGRATLTVTYAVKLNMTEEEFGNLSEDKQNELINGMIDWMDAMRSAEIEDIDVWDIYED